MPFEFALILLGPPKGVPLRVSELHPVTSKELKRLIYVWDKSQGSDPTLGFQIVSSLAIGTALFTSDLSTQINALRVAAVADVMESVVSAKLALADANIITIKVDEEGRIIYVSMI
jgi:hypothetical protein